MQLARREHFSALKKEYSERKEVNEVVGTFWLVLGYACNNRCPHCYAAPSGFSSEWMNIRFATDVMRALERMGAKTCLLIGGEPTLYPALNELISIGSKMELKMIIISNGRRLKDKTFTEQAFANGLDRAVISLEGATEDVHNTLTGRDSFRETIEGIKICTEIGQVNSLTTICRENSHQIPEIVRIASRLGVKKAVLNCAIPVISQNSVVANYSLNPFELAEIVEQMFLELREENFPFQLNTTFPLCLLRKETLTEALNLGWLSVGCHMYRGKGVVFDPNGNILPCTHFADAPLIENTMEKDGHFKLRENFGEIWENQNSIVREFRSELWRYPAKRCTECEYWGGCIGGCPLFWTFFDPEIYIDRKEVKI